MRAQDPAVHLGGRAEVVAGDDQPAGRRHPSPSSRRGSGPRWQRSSRVTTSFVEARGERVRGLEREEQALLPPGARAATRPGSCWRRRRDALQRCIAVARGSGRRRPVPRRPRSALAAIRASRPRRAAGDDVELGRLAVVGGHQHGEVLARGRSTPGGAGAGAGRPARRGRAGRALPPRSAQHRGGRVAPGPEATRPAPRRPRRGRRRRPRRRPGRRRPRCAPRRGPDTTRAGPREAGRDLRRGCERTGAGAQAELGGEHGLGALGRLAGGEGADGTDRAVQAPSRPMTESRGNADRTASFRNATRGSCRPSQMQGGAHRGAASRAARRRRGEPVSSVRTSCTCRTSSSRASSRCGRASRRSTTQPLAQAARLAGRRGRVPRHPAGG